jgi:hypothetical protein
MAVEIEAHRIFCFFLKWSKQMFRVTHRDKLAKLLSAFEKSALCNVKWSVRYRAFSRLQFDRDQ